MIKKSCTMIRSKESEEEEEKKAMQMMQMMQNLQMMEMAMKTKQKAADSIAPGAYYCCRAAPH
jgi:hypothetical protein